VVGKVPNLTALPAPICKLQLPVKEIATGCERVSQLESRHGGAWGYNVGMRIPFLSPNLSRISRSKNLLSSPPPPPSGSPDKVTLTGKLTKIAKGAVIGAVIGAAATAVGVIGTMVAGGTGALLGVAGATAMGIGLAHKMDMMVPSTFTSPSRAGREKTFYGALGGMMGGAFGATVAGFGLLTGGPALAAGAIAVGYGSVLTATRNSIMGVGEQFPNAL
jgi:hypothetical protein